MSQLYWHGGDWDFVYVDADLKQHAGWGNALTSGELVLPRNHFLNIPADKFVQNSFEIESFGDRFVLIRLDPAKGHKPLLLQGQAPDTIQNIEALRKRLIPQAC